MKQNQLKKKIENFKEMQCLTEKSGRIQTEPACRCGQGMAYQ